MYVKELYFNGFNELDSKNNSYCIDKLRLNCKITNEFFLNRIENHISVLGSNVSSWFSTKVDGFKNNYTISDASGNSFWMGFISVAETLRAEEGSLHNPKRRFNLCVDFNPNKVGHIKFLKYLLSLRVDNYSKKPIEWELRICDLAFDIKTNILNIGGINKYNKRELKTFDKGGDNKTYYIGSEKNRVKIYNKTIESELDEDLTRIEMTVYFKNTSCNEIFKLRTLDIKAFPKLYLKTYQLNTDDMEIDSTLNAILYAVNHGFPIHDLSRRYKDKVMQYENEKEPIVISSLPFLNSLKNYLSYYSFG